MSDRTVIVEPGVFGKRLGVRVHPPTVEYPLREYTDAAKAREAALELASANGWQLIDRTGGAA